MSKGHSRGAVPLRWSTSEANSVSWSQDQRIAVTSPQTVYILTLKRPQFSSRVSVLSPHFLGSSTSDGNPLFSISTANALLRENLAPLNMGGISRGWLATCPPAGQWNMMDFVDPLLVGDDENHSHDLFKASYWSPAGYSHLGGCVLTALTASGRLLLFMPPGNTARCWKMALDITSHLSVLLWPSQQLESQNGKAGKVKGKSGKGETSNGVDADSTPRPKRTRLSTSKTGFSEEYRQRRLSMACTTATWLPTLLVVNHKVIGVIAMATRTGHIVLLGVKLPIVPEKIGESDMVSLICDHQLPLECEGTDTAWACSLEWLPSASVAETTPTFYMSPISEGRAHAQLVVGCTNGQAFNLQWEFSGVNGVAGLVSCSVSSLNGVTGVCSITGVVGVTAGVSKALCLWKEADGVPVCCVASQLKFSDGNLWVVLSKSNLLVAQCLDSSYTTFGGKMEHVEIAGHHRMTISGIAAFSESSFISCALDGTLQTFSLDSTLTGGQVTPTPVAMEIQGKAKGRRAQGVAVSEMGLFAAVYINPPEKGRIQYKKLHMQSLLHFVMISSPVEVEEMIKDDGDRPCKWDVSEFVRRSYLQQHIFLPIVQELNYQTSKGRSISTSKMKLLLHTSIIKGEEDAIFRCRESIIHQHLVTSLKSWLDRDKRSPAGSDASPSDGDSQSLFCVQLMVQWILSCSKNPSTQETKIANKVLATLPSSHKTLSPLSQPEPCPACGEAVPLTDLQQDSCCHGHTWSRCSLTLCLAADSRCSCCMQCGAIVNNALTITMETGSWLNCLLQRHSCCLFCGGYFEQVI